MMMLKSKKLIVAHFPKFRLLFLLIGFCYSFLGTAQHLLKLELVKDINPNSDSNPVGFVKLGDSIFFSAYDGVNGRELWVTDGSPSGTQMLLDVKPGAGAGVHSTLQKTEGKIFFIGDDGIHGQELWVSDGTVAGTFMVKDINTGLQPYSNSYDATVILFKETLASKIFFQANDGVHGLEMWVSDGTYTGTYMIKDINPIPFDITDIPYYDAFVFNNLLYFAANDSVHGYELWVSDGTDMGTYMMKDIFPGAANGNPGGYTLLDSNILFTATDSLGSELWISDGTQNGTILLKDIKLYGSSFPGRFFEYNGKVYFSAENLGPRNELWVTDGTTSGTYLLNGVTPTHFMGFADELFFSGFDDDHWWELWVTDGTVNGTQLFEDFNSSPLPPPFFGETWSSNLSPVFKFKNYLILNGDDGNGGGQKLWVLDDTKDSIMPINYEPKNYSRPALSTGSGVELNGSMYFSSQYDSTLGKELWRMYDSTAVGVEENKPVVQSNLKVFPNPNTGNSITLELNEIFEGTIQIEMLDLSGKRVKIWDENSTPNQRIQIPTKGLKQGVFFIKVSGKNHSETVKFVKL